MSTITKAVEYEVRVRRNGGWCVVRMEEEVIFDGTYEACMAHASQKDLYEHLRASGTPAQDHPEDDSDH